MVAAAEYGGIGRDQRFTRRNPCPICGGGDDDKRGRGERCTGFLSDDGRFAFCTRPERAGRLPELGTSPASYKHLLGGVCRCGETHGAAIERPPINLHDFTPRPANTNRSHTYRTPERIHTYHTADGRDYLRVLRTGTGKDKTFTQQRPDGNGDWYDGLEGLAPILYNLPALLAADPWAPVFICEGEKACDALIERGQLATTNLGGAGKWRNTPDRLEALRGRHVVVLADNDGPGGAHADQVAADLAGVAASVRIVALPGLADKGDVFDWLTDGHTTDELRRLAAETPIITACQSPAQEPCPATQDEQGAQSQKTGDDYKRLQAENDRLTIALHSEQELRRIAETTVRNLRSERLQESRYLKNAQWSAPVKACAIEARRLYEDSRSPVQEVQGVAGVKRVSRAALADRLGVGVNAAGKAFDQLCTDGIFTKVPDTEFAEIDVTLPDGTRQTVTRSKTVLYFRPGPLFDKPGEVKEPLRANGWGGARKKRICKECGSEALEVHEYVCRDCGSVQSPAEAKDAADRAEWEACHADTVETAGWAPAQEPCTAPQDEHAEATPANTTPHTQDDTTPPYPIEGDLASLGEDAADGNASPTPADAAPDAEYVGADAIPDCPDPKHRKAITALWAYQRTHNGGAPNEREWREVSGYGHQARDVLTFMHIPTALEHAGYVYRDAGARFHLTGQPGAANGGA